jgi:hypothetical protein
VGSVDYEISEKLQRKLQLFSYKAKPPKQKRAKGVGDEEREPAYRWTVYPTHRFVDREIFAN